MGHVKRIIAVVAASMIGVAGLLVAAATAQEVKQMVLTEQHISGFIAAQTDLAAIAGKLQDAGDAPDAALQAELEAIAKKHGFKTFEELDDVASNISLVMAGLDPQSGNYVDPVEALKKELEDIKADTSIPEADKKQLTDELTEAIKSTPTLQFKENILAVQKRRAEIEKALQ